MKKSNFQAVDQPTFERYSSLSEKPSQRQRKSQLNRHEKIKDFLLEVPSCVYHHRPIKYLCTSKACKIANYSICDEEECEQLHENEPLEKIELANFNKKLLETTSSLLEVSETYQAYLQIIKNKLIQNIENDVKRLSFLFQNLYLHPFSHCLRDDPKLITSQKIHQFLKDCQLHQSHQRELMESLRTQIVNRMDEKQMANNSKKLLESQQYQGLLMMDLVIEGTLQDRNSRFSEIQMESLGSRILHENEEVKCLAKMLKENRIADFRQLKLIYRASDHHFDSLAYHLHTDAISPTVTLIQTAKHKKFGVFLNCKNNSDHDWISDPSGLSFIFSLDHNQTFKLKPEANSRLKAIFGGNEGPQIGSGCDIYLLNKCDSHSKNGANLGGSYRLPKNLEFNSKKSRSYLAGQQNFAVVEYEVFELI